MDKKLSVSQQRTLQNIVALERRINLGRYTPEKLKTLKAALVVQKAAFVKKLSS